MKQHPSPGRRRALAASTLALLPVTFRRGNYGERQTFLPFFAILRETLLPGCHHPCLPASAAGLRRRQAPLRRARRCYAQPIDRGRGRHVEAAPVVVAEAEIGGVLGHADDAEAACVRGKD